MKFIPLALIILLSSCKNMEGNTPGFIGGEKGHADWSLYLDLGIIAPIGIGFKGKRTSEPEGE